MMNKHQERYALPKIYKLTIPENSPNAFTTFPMSGLGEGRSQGGGWASVAILPPLWPDVFNKNM